MSNFLTEHSWAYFDAAIHSKFMTIKLNTAPLCSLLPIPAMALQELKLAGAIRKDSDPGPL